MTSRKRPRYAADRVAYVVLGALIALAILVPLFATPAIVCVGVINVVRHARTINDGRGAPSTIVLLVANGVLATVAMVVFIAMAGPA
jgi:hypothetical protein